MDSREIPAPKRSVHWLVGQGTPHLIRAGGHQLCRRHGEETERLILLYAMMAVSALQSCLMSTSRLCVAKGHTLISSFATCHRRCQLAGVTAGSGRYICIPARFVSPPRNECPEIRSCLFCYRLTLPTVVSPRVLFLLNLSFFCEITLPPTPPVFNDLNREQHSLCFAKLSRRTPVCV